MSIINKEQIGDIKALKRLPLTKKSLINLPTYPRKQARKYLHHQNKQIKEQRASLPQHSRAFDNT